MYVTCTDLRQVLLHFTHLFQRVRTFLSTHAFLTRVSVRRFLLILLRRFNIFHFFLFKKNRSKRACHVDYVDFAFHVTDNDDLLDHVPYVATRSCRAELTITIDILAGRNLLLLFL